MNHDHGYFDRRFREGVRTEKTNKRSKPPGGMTRKEWLEYRKAVGLYKPRKRGEKK